MALSEVGVPAARFGGVRVLTKGFKFQSIIIFYLNWFNYKKTTFDQKKKLQKDNLKNLSGHVL